MVKTETLVWAALAVAAYALMTRQPMAAPAPQPAETSWWDSVINWWD